jgi:hypothetical protein
MNVGAPVRVVAVEPVLDPVPAEADGQAVDAPAELEPASA